MKAKKTVSAGGIVLNRRGEVLVVNQHGNSWSLPKGHIDPGEDALTAAKREILEESGIQELTLVKFLGQYERPRIGLHGGDDPTELKEIHMYLFITSEEVLNPQDPHHPEARWVAPDGVAELLTHEKDQEFYLAWVKELSRLVRTRP